jgi:cytochrome c-type biogenesis protein CcmF
MGALGTYGLLFGLVLAAGGAVVAFAGARSDRPALVENARRIAFGLLAAMVLVNGTMVAALLGDDFTLRYVAGNSSRETPVLFKVLSLWAADDGSLLFWNLILAGYVAAVAIRFRRYRPPTFPYALGVLFLVQAFYLVLVNGPARPFGTLGQPPADGRGPAPLLQNHPLMAVHPPFLYLGFIGFTVPFAFGVAALLAGGGSGYWAWDPVENVALLPWLVSTAFLHSIMLQERRGMARLWNIALVVGAFALTTFGTFLTRGSVLSSVHAFAQSAVGPAYLVFLGLVLLGGFGLVAWRLPQLRSPARLDSTLSREAAFVGNNLLLLGATAIILLGTAFPLVVEALTGDQITIGGPYFRSALAPVFLLVLLLAGTAPLLPWRAVNRERAIRRLRVPVVAAALVVLGCAVAGLRDLYAVAGFGLATLVLVANVQEIATGLAMGRRGGRAGMWRTFLRGRRRYAGLTVHIGLALLAIGITASSNLVQQTQVTLRAGQSTTFAGRQLTYQGLETDQQAQRVVLTARVVVAGDGTLDPRMNLYPAASEPIGSPSIHRGFVHDLYASVISLQDNGNSATFRFYRNPGVNWLWIGGALMALGGAVAAWPARRRRAEEALVAAEHRRQPAGAGVV